MQPGRETREDITALTGSKCTLGGVGGARVSDLYICSLMLGIFLALFL